MLVSHYITICYIFHVIRSVKWCSENLEAAAALQEVDEARAVGGTTTLIPPWMLHHFTR